MRNWYWYLVLFLMLSLASRQQTGAAAVRENPEGTLGQTGSTTPQPPAAFFGVAESSSSIRWSWSAVPNATYYTLHDNYTDLPIAGAESILSTSFLESGLSENTEYARHVHACNGYGISLSSASSSVYTLVNITTYTVAALSRSEITIAVTPPPNPTAGLTGVQIRRTGSALPLGPFSQEYTQVDSNLKPKTEYCYTIQLRNGDGKETGFNTSEQCAVTQQQQQDPACHKGSAEFGYDRTLVDKDGVITEVRTHPFCVPPPPSPAGEFGATLPTKHLTEDCRHRSGSFKAFAQSLGQEATAGSPLAHAQSTNTASKLLRVIKTPEAGECCHKFEAGGEYSISASWLVSREAVQPNEGRVFINEPGKPRFLEIRADWVDCEGISRHRFRAFTLFVEAEVAWDAQGKIIRDKLVGVIREYYKSDVVPLELVRVDVLAGSAESGIIKDERLEVDHPDDVDGRIEFQGLRANDVAAKIGMNGLADVLAEAPKGARPHPHAAFARVLIPSLAIGEFHAEVKKGSLVLIDKTENIRVPDP